MKWVSNVYKCDSGHLLALEFESDIRPLTNGEKIIWLDLHDRKEYPAKLKEAG